MKCTIGDTLGDGTKGDWVCEGETVNKNGVCRSCQEAGWTNNPIEVASAIAADKELRNRVGIVAPIQPEHEI